MKAGELAIFFGTMDPDSEVKIATAAHGEPLVESIIVVKSFGARSVLIEGESFMNELNKRAEESPPAPRKLRIVQ